MFPVFSLFSLFFNTKNSYKKRIPNMPLVFLKMVILENHSYSLFDVFCVLCVFYNRKKLVTKFVNCVFLVLIFFQNKK